jgi:GAF domain-containing protein
MADDYPMNLEATHEELKKVQKQQEQCRGALRLANLEIERRNQSLVTLAGFARRVSLATCPSELLKLALETALAMTRASMGAIVLIDTKTGELTLGIHEGLTPELLDILTGQQLEAGATVLMPHLVAGEGALLELDTTDDEIEKLLLTTGQLTSLVSLPLQLGPTLMGALLVGHQNKRTFRPVELNLLMAISQETAVALEGLRLRDDLWYTAETLLGEKRDDIDLQQVEQINSDTGALIPFNISPTTQAISQPTKNDSEQLLAAMIKAEEEVQQQHADLQTLNIITEIINHTLNLNRILHCTVDQTQAILETDAAWLYLVNERNQLEMRARIGLSKEYVQDMQRLKPGEGIEGQVVVENKAYFVEALSKDIHKHKIWIDREGLHALAAVPLTRPESDSNSQTGSGQENGLHVIGVLATGKRATQAYRWSPRERRLLTSIANQVAPAIANAHLYTQAEGQQLNLIAGNEALHTINDMLFEKNAYLEGFIQDDLIPMLSQTCQGLEHLLAENSSPLSEGQKQEVASLQKIVSQLNELGQETIEVSDILDTELDRLLASESIQNDYAGSIKPIRLEKRGNDS